MSLITALPAAPARTMASATYISTSDAFLAALPTMVTQINGVISAFNAAQSGTSITSLTVGTGAQTLTTQTGLSFLPGQSVFIASTVTPTTRMAGTVTAYNSVTGSLSVTVTSTSGAGNLASWQIGLNAMSIQTPADVAAVLGYTPTPNTFRNLLINGNYDVWQRGTSQTGAGYLSADRWKFDTLTAVTAAQVAAGAGVGVYSMNLTPSNAVNAVTKAQTLESTRVALLKGKNGCYSINASCSLGTVSATIYIQKSATANASSGGGGGWTSIASQAITITTTPQQFFVTGAIPNDATAAGLRVALVTSNTPNGVSFALWQEQLEVGTSPTVYDFRAPETEIQLCQRYYQTCVTGLIAYAVNGLVGMAWPGGQMRTTPSIAISSGGIAGNVRTTSNAVAVSLGTVSSGASSSGTLFIGGTGSSLTTGAAYDFTLALDADL